MRKQQTGIEHKTINLILATGIAALYLIVLIVSQGVVGPYQLGQWMGNCLLTLLVAVVIEKVVGSRSESAGAWAGTLTLIVMCVLTIAFRS